MKSDINFQDSLIERLRSEFHRQYIRWAAFGVFLLLLSAYVNLRLDYGFKNAGYPGGWFIFTKTFSHTTMELGFAIIIAVIVGRMFEHSTRVNLLKEIDEKVDQVKEDVFRSVFEWNIPREFTNEVLKLLSNTPLIRTDFKVTYELEQDFYTSRHNNRVPFICVKATADLTMKNNSSEDVQYPVRLMLPNPIIDELKPRTKVSTVKVEDMEFTTSESEADFRKNLEDDNTGSAIYDCGSVTIKASSQISLFKIYYMAKEMEDSEIIQTFYPTRRLRVIVSDKTKSRIIRADVLSRGKLQTMPVSGSPEQNIWEVDHWLMPHQGIHFWWKSDPTLPQAEAF